MRHDPNIHPQSTTDWTRSIPYSSSPPHNSSSRASVAGSPPQHQQSAEELRGGFTHASPPVSPRAAYRQPISRAKDYQSFGDYLGTSPNNRRPLSMYSQNPHHPPLPHQAQAHFYGAPDIKIGMPKPSSETRNFAEGCCCVLDSLPSVGKEGGGNPENVLLAGFDHGLDVYHLSKKRFDRIGCIGGLRGAVIGAKILPFQPRGTLQVHQPLVVVVVHGPFVPAENSPLLEAEQVEDEEFDPSKSTLQAMQVAETSYFQTTVEIYSMSKGEHVANLYRSPKIEVRLEYGGQSTAPPPIGDLKVQASGRFLIVSSGSSGEVHIYDGVLGDNRESLQSFKCIGKIWTRTSTTGSRPTSSPASDSDVGGHLDAHVRRMNAAIVSLSDRWLAVVPPPSSSLTTLHGQINVDSSNYKIPGLSSHTPPTEPQITCDLDTPEDGSVLNRVARDVAQGALKSAQWVAAEGMQAWNNYWSKPVDHNRNAGALGNHGFTASSPPLQTFPPTHALDNSYDRARSQPTMVSILDLTKLSQSQHLKPSVALHPLATFSLQHGCSALSFSPSGLNLLTASAKGDVQHVWDLMRIAHGESGRVEAPDAISKGPTVRQIARFSRMTEARIIDVVWTEPRGERFAIITERGTVHINDLPLSAFQWPPHRRRPPTVTPTTSQTQEDSKGNDAVRPQSVGSTFGSAFGMFAGRTHSALTSVRGRSPSTSGGFTGFGSLAMTAGASAKGGKVIAAGINRSVSAAATSTVSTIRHYGENRLTLPTSPNPVSPGCARWLNGKNQGSIAVTGGGVVRVHSIRQSTDPKARQRRPSVIADRPVEFSLSKGGPSARHGASGNILPAAETSISPGSYWQPQASRPSSRRSQFDTHPLSFAEIETNAPYQPFHTDRRVNLFVYDGNVTVPADPHHLHDPTPWVFGGTIPTIKISTGSASDHEDEGNTTAPSIVASKVRTEGNVEDGQRIVSTTTWRRKSKKSDGAEMKADEGDFFEDDCEVLDYAEDRV